MVREEMWAHHEPRGAQYMGVNWVGPTIMRHGTTEQQRQHLPAIARARSSGARASASRTPDPTWLRYRPRLAATARAGECRPEDLDLLRHDGAVVLPARPDLARGKKQRGLTIFLVPMEAQG